MLSDGDSEVFVELQEMKVYRNEVEIKERRVYQSYQQKVKKSFGTNSKILLIKRSEFGKKESWQLEGRDNKKNLLDIAQMPFLRIQTK